MKTRLLLLLILLAATVVRAETYGGREDVAGFIADMQARHGFDAAELEVLFGRTKPIAAVIKAIMPPKDPGIRSWAAYRQRFIEPRRIAAGQRFRQQHAAALARAETRYGVPAEIILAIIGVETIYGRHTGRFNTFAALTTLAFDYPPRAELFRRELEALLLLAREEKRDPLSYKGSFAGALGLPQFLPSSRRLWGTDFDGDGHVDLAASPADAIGSVANFLKEHGWETGGPIALPVIVSGDPAPLIDEGIKPKRLPVEMASYGVQADAAPAQAAAVIDLVTPAAATEYWLGFNNFYVLTRYNRSTFYAMAVFQLAEELRTNRTEEDYSTASRPTPSRDMRRRS
ncbi:MAG: lytic murein transglycosylase B [Sterolibacteriaceae bacterium MAG5]|nr:lytic murein transglycosylase B [Candidatus Nitricoxidireducens bremensis]